MQKPKNFEDAMQRLEAIVAELEQGALPLDISLKKYKEGIELTNYCNDKLQEAEKQVKQLTKVDDKFSLPDTDF